MAEEGKKISFGFAKSIKKPILKNATPQEEKRVDYIECLDQKAIKVIGEEEKKEAPLIIPLLGSRTWHDRIINKIDADIFEPKITTNDSNVTDSIQEKISNGDTQLNGKSVSLSNAKLLLDNKKNPMITLEEQAAKEILEDLTSTKKKNTPTELLTLSLNDDASLRGEHESTLDDYENIPVDAFGLAMLRGMGWQPGKGIGKNEKIVAAVVPELRPKGMGLGADKVTVQKQAVNSKKPADDLKIVKGSFVKIIAGKQSNNYGQIEGFDDDAGRLIVKMTLEGNTISVNEFMVQAVTKSEYTKNAKVLNATKYEEYKDKQTLNKEKNTQSNSSKTHENDKIYTEEWKSNSNSDVDKSKSHKKMEREKEKVQKRHSSDSESDYGIKKRRESSCSSSNGYVEKKVKKSRKHKRRDSSTERSSKKHKKKDKERGRTKHKKIRCDAERFEKRKHKKHKKSRSQSPN